MFLGIVEKRAKRRFLHAALKLGKKEISDTDIRYHTFCFPDPDVKRKKVADDKISRFSKENKVNPLFLLCSSAHVQYMQVKRKLVSRTTSRSTFAPR